jgi:hypothetical protein
VQAQETITNASANLFGTSATVLIAVAAVAAFALGADQVADLLEIRLPVRQLMVGRTLQALTLSGRFCCMLARSYISAWAGRPRGGLLQRSVPSMRDVMNRAQVAREAGSCSVLSQACET